MAVTTVSKYDTCWWEVMVFYFTNVLAIRSISRCFQKDLVVVLENLQAH